MSHGLARLSPRVVGRVCFVTTAGCTAASIIAGDGPPVAVRFLVLAAAFVSFGGLFVRPVRDAVLTKGRVVAVSGALLLVAVAVPPVGHDMWSYAMYGRMVSVHGVSPYTHVPADYPNDPLLSLVGWRNTPSVYGPGFVAVAAVGTAVTGSSPLANRVFFQGIEALAMAGAMVLVWRRTRDPAALAFVGLNPALIAAVTDGHNDLLVGVAVLAGALLVTDERPVAAGVAMAAGALVKIVVLLPLAGLFVWAWVRWGRVKAFVMAGVAAGVIIGAYACAGGWSALQPVLDAAGKRTTRASFWNWPGAVGVRPGPLPLLTLALIAAALIVLPRRSGSPAWVAGAVVLAFLLTAQYVLPWYVAWGLPTLALVWRSRLALLAAAQAAVLALSYVPVRGTGGVWRVYYEILAPLGFVVALIGLVVLAARESGPRALAPLTGADRATPVREAPGGS